MWLSGQFGTDFCVMFFGVWIRRSNHYDRFGVDTYSALGMNRAGGLPNISELLYLPM